jgi:hypothetical protein
MTTVFLDQGQSCESTVARDEQNALIFLQIKNTPQVPDKILSFLSECRGKDSLQWVGQPRCLSFKI